MNWKSQAAGIKAIAVLAWVFGLCGTTSSAGAVAGVTNVAHATGETTVVVFAPPGRVPKGNSVLVSGPSSFWSGNPAARAGGSQTNQTPPRPLPSGATRDGVTPPIADNEGSVLATGKVLQVMAGFTNNTTSTRPANFGLLRALGPGTEAGAAQTFSNVGVIAVSSASFASVAAPVAGNFGLLRALGAEAGASATQAFTNVGIMVVSNAGGGPVVAPATGSAFNVRGPLLQSPGGVLRVVRSSQSVLDNTATNRTGGVAQSRRMPLLNFNQGAADQDVSPVIGPSTAIHSGLLLLSPTGIVSVPTIVPSLESEP